MTSDQASVDGIDGRTIIVPYTKSDRCYTIVVDGAWGGTTPDGGVYAALYTQQQSLPTKVTLEIEEGFVTKAGQTEQLTQIERIVQAELRMTTRTARSLGVWLIDKADNADNVLREIAERRQAQEDSASEMDSSE